jgi:GNAT superfamily N-acetyltransferase
VGALSPPRAARPGDGAAIGALAVRAWRAAYAGVLAAEVLAALDPAAQARDWAEYLAALPPADRVWVVGGTDGGVAGFARTGPCTDADVPAGTGEVHGLYIEPALIGTGLGRSLFEHAVADLAGRHDPVVLWHFAGNNRAARFYELAGFGLDGARRPSDHGPDEVRRRSRG